MVEFSHTCKLKNRGRVEASLILSRETKGNVPLGPNVMKASGGIDPSLQHVVQAKKWDHM